MRGEEQIREKGEMAQTKLGGRRNRGKKERGEREKKLNFREEGEIGSESRRKGDLPPCSTLLCSEVQLDEHRQSPRCLPVLVFFFKAY